MRRLGLLHRRDRRARFRLPFTAALARVILGLPSMLPGLARAESAPAPPPPSTAPGAAAGGGGTPGAGAAGAAESPAPRPAPPASVPAGASAPATPAPGGAPVPPALPGAPQPQPPGDALIHVGASHSGTWLEGRSRVDEDAWRPLCAAPCDRLLHVDGLELRVTAPGMTTSNAFLVEPGPGVARLRVAGGSSTMRALGIGGLAGGLPVTFAGMALLGGGHLKEDDGLRTAGIVTLSVGAAAVLVALPMLLLGSTSVKNHRGKSIAAVTHPTF